MNIYRLHIGYIEKFIAAESEADAKAQGENPTLHPDIHYLPFTVTQVEITGYIVTAMPIMTTEQNVVVEDTADKPRRGRRPQ